MSKELSTELRDELDRLSEANLLDRREAFKKAEYHLYLKAIWIQSAVRITVLGAIGIIFLFVWKPGTREIITVATFFITYVATETSLIMSKKYKAQEMMMIAEKKMREMRMRKEVLRNREESSARSV